MKSNNKLNNTSILIIDNNAKISLIWLIELGKLLLAGKKNDNNNRKIEDIKKNPSNNLVLVLLINNLTRILYPFSIMEELILITTIIIDIAYTN